MPPSDPARTATPWPYPTWFAHRGAGTLAPENTLAAFRRGAAQGFRAFECDVKLSADGVPFLLHDATLERTTDGQGSAGRRRWTELALCDAGSWHSSEHAGEPLPTLQDIARYVQAHDFLLNIEIKPTPGLEQTTGEAVGRACTALWPATATPPLLSSFDPDALAGALTTAPALPRALLLDTLWAGWLAAAQRLDCVAVVTNWRVMDAALMATLQAHRLRGLCYTVNDGVEAQRLLALGVAGLITDAVDRLGPGA